MSDKNLVKDLIRKWTNDGYRPNFIYFWSTGPRYRNGTMGPGCMCQWYQSPFTIDGIEYPTAEHWMMASKARLFKDTVAEQKILATRSPKDVKMIGRTIKDFDENIWEQNRYAIVVQGNIEKFRQHENLRNYLLGTGDDVVVEASPYDRIWGVGMSEGDDGVDDPTKWKGLNLLGFAIMEARQELRRES